ncbi:MAG: DUF882 domain-containing protein [Myxococcota bacterium]
MRSVFAIVALVPLTAAPAWADEGAEEPGAGARTVEQLPWKKTRFFTGWAAGRLRTERLDRPSGSLEVENVHTGEVLFTNIYNPDGTYNADALASLDRIWRCVRTEHEQAIDPALFDILSHVYDRFGRRILLYSGHRMNTTGNHFKGSASDIRVEGVANKKLRNYVQTLDTGGMGIGLYTRSNFVHVDIRPPPSYRWIDRSPPGYRDRRAKRKPKRVS